MKVFLMVVVIATAVVSANSRATYSDLRSWDTEWPSQRDWESEPEENWRWAPRRKLDSKPEENWRWAPSRKLGSKPEENWWAPEKQSRGSQVCEDTKTMIKYQSMQITNMQTLLSMLLNKIDSLKLQGYRNGSEMERPWWMKHGGSWGKDMKGGGEGGSGGDTNV